MKLLIFLCAFCGSVFGQLDCRRDFLFVIDSSGSLKEEFKTLKQFISGIGRELTISHEKHQVALLEYSGRNRRWPTYKFGSIPSNKDFDRIVSKLPHLKGTTATGEALRRAKFILDSRKKKTQKIPTIMIVISDGFSHDRVEVPMKNLQKINNFQAFTATVTKNFNRPEMRIIAGDDSRIFHGASALEDLKRQLRQFTRCGPPQIRINKPSMDSLKTKKLLPSTTYRVIPTIPPISGCALDLVLAVDLSRSVSNSYETSLSQAIRLIEALKIDPKKTRIAAVGYSSRAKTLFPLNRYNQPSDMKRHLERTRLMSGITSARKAIHLTQQQLFSAKNGARPSANKVTVIFTDGFSRKDPTEDARKLREKSVDIYAVAVPSAPIYLDGLYEIAGSRQRIFASQKRFEDLVNLIQQYNNEC